jgi:hypothetical protein
MKFRVRLNALLPVTTTIDVDSEKDLKTDSVSEAIGFAIRVTNYLKLKGDCTSLFGIGDLGWDASPAIDHDHLHDITVEEVATDEPGDGYVVLWNQETDGQL